MVKYLTVGVAGHVDHGKTSLVKVLTGVETDRLKEEKRRGLSIEAGIAPLNLSDDLCLALIDVPGHTDFLKNTIRGLNSVDIAILVVAADDGVMPQTIDHLKILELIGVKYGFIVLTKADLVDAETLTIAEEELKDAVMGSIFEKSPIIFFSAIDQRGINDIMKALRETAEKTPHKDTDAPFRLWIDQVKVIIGFGTIASGTILSGTITKGDALYILPEFRNATARFMETHHKKIETGIAGQRIGINLSRIDKEDVYRGALLTKSREVNMSYLLNAELSILKYVNKPLKNRQKVKLFIGTGALNAMCIIMGDKSIMPGEKGFIQFRLLNHLPAMAGDKFIISLLNCPAVIGGGSILEVSSRKYRPVNHNQTIQYLSALTKGNVDTVIDFLHGRLDSPLLNPEKIAAYTGLSFKRITCNLNTGLKNDDYFNFKGKGLISRTYYNNLKKKLLSTINSIVSANPFLTVISFEKIKKQFPSFFNASLLQGLFEDLYREGKIVKENNGYYLPDFSVPLTPRLKNLISLLLDYARESGITPFTEYAFWTFHNKKLPKKEIHNALNHLCFQNRLVYLKNDRYLSLESLEQIKIRINNVINTKKVIKITDCKDILGYGRNIGIPVLEYLDSIGFTCRQGNERVLVDTK